MRAADRAEEQATGWPGAMPDDYEPPELVAAYEADRTEELRPVLMDFVATLADEQYRALVQGEARLSLVMQVEQQCYGAPAGFEADCGQPGPHQEHTFRVER